MAYYVDYYALNDLQIEIMKYVDIYVRQQKTPVPRQKIIEEFKKRKIKDFTCINAISSLLHKGFIRTAIMPSSRQTHYVQLRRVQ